MTGAEIIVVVVAVMTGSLVKSVTGMGLPVVAIPVIALFVSVEDAVIVMALPGLAANGILCARELSHRRESRDLARFGVAGVAGAVVGTALLVWLPEKPVLGALVVLVVFYVITFFRRPDLRIDPGTSRRWSPAVGTVAGLFQGSTGISGPVVVTWFHGYRLPRGAHIYSVTLSFLIAAVAQFAALLADGRMAGRWGASLAAVVPTVAMIPIGTRLRERLSGRSFDLAVIGILGVSATGLVVRLVG